MKYESSEAKKDVITITVQMYKKYFPFIFKSGKVSTRLFIIN